MDWAITFEYPKLARLFDLKPIQEEVDHYNVTQHGLIRLPGGDWLVPIASYCTWFYDETENCITELEQRDATAEEIRELVEKGVQVTGNTQIAAFDPVTTAESFTVEGLGKRKVIYVRGGEIPLLDADAQKLFDRFLATNPHFYVMPGEVFLAPKG